MFETFAKDGFHGESHFHDKSYYIILGTECWKVPIFRESGEIGSLPVISSGKKTCLDGSTSDR